jgi:hypothetical protein
MKRAGQSGAAFLPPRPSFFIAKQPMAGSHGPATAADLARSQSVAARNASHTTPAVRSLVELEALWSAPATDAACLMQCLYIADRCDRNCAGCAATANARREGAPLAGKGAAESGRQCAGRPDGNHGDNLQ